MSEFRWLVSTDLDGTLLDHHTYSWQAAEPALARCRADGVPVIINTSKTQAEVETIQQQLQLRAPLIVENGSALLIPQGFLSGEIPGSESGPIIERETDCVRVIFGATRARVRDFTEKVRTDEGWRFEGFGDWTVAQIAQHTGLSLSAARAAAEKRYSEPLVWNDSDANYQRFEERVDRAGLKLLRGGRFVHLQGQTNKAKPLLWLRRHLSLVFPESDGICAPKLICLGDNHNDVDMLNIADYPVCIRSPVSDYPVLTTQQPIFFSERYGPAGWNEAMLSILGHDLSSC